MSDYENIEINSKKEYDDFVNNATKEELLLLKSDLEEIKKAIDDDGGRERVHKR